MSSPASRTPTSEAAGPVRAIATVQDVPDVRDSSMKSLYLRIWLTVVAALALFALVSGWMWHHHVEQDRVRYEAVASERLAAWAELVQHALPAVDAPQKLPNPSTVDRNAAPPA